MSLKHILFYVLYVALMPSILLGQYGGTFAKIINNQQDPNPSFFLSQITFESDVPFSNEEFLYTTDLKEETLITKQHIDTAYRLLMEKKRFAHIDINAHETPQGKHVHIICKGAWIFKKLTLKGIWFGKQEYASLYAQHPGDIFDAMLHEESIKSIKQYLFNQGYFNSTVHDQIIYEKKRKTITAKIVVHRKSRFSVSNVIFNAPNNLNDVLQKNFGERLLHEPYAKKNIEKLIKKVRKFLKHQGFARTHITLEKHPHYAQKTVDLTFTIKTGSKRTLELQGNTIFSQQQIKKDILGQNQPDWLFNQDVITEQIRYEYYKKGYWDTTITSSKTAENSYNITINEGTPTIIEAIELKDIKTHLPDPALPFWQELLLQKTFNQNLLDDGIEQLKKHYYADGFWDFTIVEKRFIKNKETDNYIIQLFLDKGTQRLFAGIQIEGFQDLEQHPFFKKYKLPGYGSFVPFSYDWLSEQRSFLITHFQKQNYWYVDVQPDLRIFQLPMPQGNQETMQAVKVQVLWKIKRGEPVTFGKFFLRGTTKLPFRTIAREISFQQKEPWNKEKIELTRKKLKRLDIFKTIQLQPSQLAQPTSEKPILLTLVDDDPIELRMRLGYFWTSKNFMFKRQSTPKIGSSLILRNPTNRADKLTFNGDWTLFERKFDLEYQQPSFLNYSIMSKFKGYTNKYSQPVRIGKSDSAYEAYQHGFLIGLADEYKHDYHWGLSIGNEWMRTSRVRGYLKLAPSMIDHTTPYFFTEPSLVIDKLDDRMNTKKGSLTFFSLKCMVPENKGKSTARLIAEQAFFYPIHHDIILATRLRIGYIFRRNFEYIMPIERFYLGGPHSVRGYEVDALPPLGVIEKDATGAVIKTYTTNGETNHTLPSTTTKEYTIQGGSSMLNGNIELRFPLIKNLGGVAFQDVGVLSQSGLAGFKEKWYPASGFGLRYKTPIGALRFDIGWKWKRRLEKDSAYCWYLTLGESF